MQVPFAKADRAPVAVAAWEAGRVSSKGSSD